MTDIIATVTSWLSGNQFLAGGIGTVVFGSIMYVLRATPVKIKAALLSLLTSSLVVNSSKSRGYDQIVEYLAEYRLTFGQRNFSIFYNRIAAGYGVSYGRWEGVWFRFTKTQVSSSWAMEEQTEIIFLTRDRSIITRFYQESTKPKADNRIEVTTHNGDAIFSKRRPKREIESVFVPTAQKRQLIDRIEWFITNEEWYAKRGIPYKLCIMLYGEPGTGKTSLVHALASYFNRSIHYVDSMTAFDKAVRDADEKSVIVAEDFDTILASGSRGPLPEKNTAPIENKKTDSPNAVVAPTEDLMAGLLAGWERHDLHTVLNMLDGLQTPHGMMMFLTTNHPEAFDPAVIRPGRIDMMLEIGRLDTSDMRKMFLSFFGEESAPQLDRWLSTHTFVPQTGARLQQIFVSNDAAESLAIMSKTCAHRSNATFINSNVGMGIRVA